MSRLFVSDGKIRVRPAGTGSARRELSDVGAAASDVLTADGSGAATWTAPSGGSTHPILGSTTHTDTLTGTVIRGDLMIGNATPKWARVALGTSGKVLRSDGTDAAWSRLAAVELSNGVTGTGSVVLFAAPTLIAPTIASMTNAQHDHADAVGGGKIADQYITLSRIIYVETPTASDDFPIGYVEKAGTITRIIAVTDVGTVDFNIEIRNQLTPDQAGTDVDTTEMVATVSGLNQTSGFENSPGDGKWLTFVSSAVASSPTKVWISVTIKIT